MLPTERAIHIAPLADARRDHDLIRLAQGGDIQARNVLIQRHYGFIWKWTQRGLGRNTPHAVEEFVGLGVEAFIRAVELFNPAITGSLLTYAAEAIERRVYKHSREFTIIRVPEPSRRTVPNWEGLRERAMGIASLDSTYDDGHKRIDHAGSDANARRLERSERIAEVLQGMDRRDMDILIARAQGLTLQQIGTDIGLSKERVRQIESGARERLTTALAGVL